MEVNRVTLFLGIALLLTRIAATNMRPIIGVVTKPLQEEYPDITTDYTEVIEAKYVHFIEGGGGRVFPISYKWDAATISKYITKLNGVLFTGGGTELLLFDDHSVPIGLTEYSKGGRRILDAAIELNKNGVHFPVWGTCLGFELLLILESGNLNLLGHCNNCSNYDASLIYTNEGRESRMFGAFSARELRTMELKNITRNNHVLMVDDKTFYAQPKLVENYRVLAHSLWFDESAVYISAVEHRTLPFYGVQFHPEKWNYEVNPAQNVIKTKEAIMLGHAFSDFVVEEARMNDNKFASYDEELKIIVENSFHYYHPSYGYMYFLGKKA